MAILLATSSLGSHAQSGSEPHQQTGSIHLHLVTAGFIASTGSGTGTLSYQGREYPLKVADVSLGTIGVSGMELAGTVYNLRAVTDITGRYTSAGAELTIGAGVEMGRFGNANGVVIELAGSARRRFGRNDYYFAVSDCLLEGARPAIGGQVAHEG
jgi:hypothetical protein